MQPPIQAPVKAQDSPTQALPAQPASDMPFPGKTSPTKKPAKTRTGGRRWQLSLRDVMFLLLLTAVLAGWWRDRWNLVDQLNTLMDQVNGGSSWSFEQVLGPPDTSKYGDIPTAWASQTPDGQREWLLLEFPLAVLPKAIEVHETYNPGAIDQVSVWDPAGKEVVVWTGTDPLPRRSRIGTSIIPINTRFKTRKIKIQLDSVNVPGWNEIDAVGLRGRDGSIQWASGGRASSSFGGSGRMFFPSPGTGPLFRQGSFGAPNQAPATQAPPAPRMLVVPLDGNPQAPPAPPESSTIGP